MNPVIGFKRGLPHHPENLLFPYAWLEAPLAARLAKVEEISDWNDPETWPSGRLFGEEGEYCWQRLPDKSLHAVLLLESGDLPSGFESPILLEKGEDASLILWGEWVNPEGDPEGNPGGGPSFYARDLPEIQRYPVEGDLKPGTVTSLLVRRYRDREGKRGEFIRCVGFRLTAAGDPDHA